MSNKMIMFLKSLPDYIGGSGRSEEEIASSEQALGLIFAEDYRQYLSKIGLACFDGRELTGISKSPRIDVVAVTNKMREMNDTVPADFYVIEETGVDGIVIWQATSGEVYQTMPNKQPQKICESLVDYITR